MKKVLFPLLAAVFLLSGPVSASEDRTNDSFQACESGFRGYATDAYGDASLSTLFASNHQYAGNSFDVMASTELTIVGFDINLAVGIASHTIDVYYRAGTADGFEQNAGAWTHLGSDVVIPAGIDVPTHVDVGGLFLNSGDTVGIIILTQEATDFRYTNGGPNTYSNADMDIITYRALAGGWPPTAVFAYRVWNGTIHYDFSTTLDNETWTSIKSAF